MEIIAYKDPETGKLFETLKAFNDFQKDRVDEKAAQAAAEARDAERVHMAMLLCNELASKSQLPELARRMYEFKLDRLPLRAGQKPPEVCSVRVTSWHLTDSLQLQVGVEVTLHRDPHKVFLGQFHDLTPNNVLHPFRLWGSCGCSPGPAGEYIMSYELATELEKLPLLLENVKRAGLLLNLQQAHLKKLTQAQEAAKAADSQLQGLSEEVLASRAAVEAATQTWEDAARRKTARKSELDATVSSQMVFDHQKELDDLREATGLSTQADYWQLRIVSGLMGHVSKGQANSLPESQSLVA